MDDDTLTKAIFGTIGDLDGYQLPDAKGYSSLVQYLLGVTDEERERRREEILSTRLKVFKEFADVVKAVKDGGVVVAVASPDDSVAANKERSNFFEVKKALEMESSTATDKKTSMAAKPSAAKMPSAEEIKEIEEFFSEAEKLQQKRFAEKYNYDIVKDEPLEGRYQWVLLKP